MAKEKNRGGVISKMSRRRRKPRVPRKLNKWMKKKIIYLFVGILAVVVVLNGRLVYISYKSGDPYKIQVLAQQQYNSQTVPFKRGDITDRKGNVLATSVKVYNLVLDPKVIMSNDQYVQPTIEALTTCFDELKNSDLKKEIENRKTSSYYVVKKKLTYEQIEKFLNIQKDTKKNPNVKGVHFEEEYERQYPYSTLACHVLGFANASNTAETGIEAYYNSELNGTDGREFGYMNEDNAMEKVVKEPENGNNIVSTIDMNIQRIVESKIKSYQKNTARAKSISVLIMNPNNGEILAMASDKIYNLNEPRDLKTYYGKKEAQKITSEEKKDKKKGVDALSEMWRNKCVSDTFEPGSTMKPFTVAAALEEGKAKKSSTYVCDGGQQVADRYIKCHKETGHGTITLEQAITYSCNDALMQIGLNLGKDIFSSYQSRFGFGMKSKVDLPGEASGILYSAENMGETTLATNAFGQNFTVNMVQLAAGYSSLINGGNYYTPHLVKRIETSEGGLVKNVAASVVKQTVTKSTSDFINDALRTVVLDGTGRKAVIDGYDVGGKTGTAEKLPRGNDQYVLSFIGSVPCEKPEVVCYVVIDTPKENPSDSGYAAELFNNIMTEVLPYMNIYKSKEETNIKKTKNSGEAESYQNGSYLNGQDVGVTDPDGNYNAGENTTTNAAGDTSDGTDETQIQEESTTSEADITEQTTASTP